MERKKHAKRLRENSILKRIVSAVLCFCLLFSVLFGATGFLNQAFASPTDAVTRIADGDTSDTYKDLLLSERWGSRYAGRIWNDKSVIAHAGTDGFQEYGLNTETDGYAGSVGFDSDFLHIYSALASTQRINEYPPSPIDLVIVFDMSGSMGQDTRFSIDAESVNYLTHNGDSESWPEGGVEMSDRIKNSRIQKTLDAINRAVTDLMRQNLQNRVAVVGYGASATVLMPLAHWDIGDAPKDGVKTFLSVGGMETLLFPGDLQARKVADNDYRWYWINNRDTAYTVRVNGKMNESTEPLNAANVEWKEVSRTVSNNVSGREDLTTADGQPVNAKVRAFPGVPSQTAQSLSESAQAFVEKNYGEKLEKLPHNATADQPTEGLADIVKDVYRMDADEYVGYLTNTQGGVYLGYKQLADSKVTVYSEALSTGKKATVARLPAAVIMSDGGANFALNPLGTVTNRNGDALHWKDVQQKLNLNDYRIHYLNYKEWSSTGRKRNPNEENILEDAFGKGVYNNDDKKAFTYPADSWMQFDALRRYYQLPDNFGDEWYKVWLPTPDVFEDITGGYDDKNFKGVPSLYNIGADLYLDGTMRATPNANQVGVLYSNDALLSGTTGTTLELLLTASYMRTVVEKYYRNGWQNENAAEGSRKGLLTYTMNVDSENVPEWGRWRLYASLDPKHHALDDIDVNDPDSWVNDTKELGQAYQGSAFSNKGQQYHNPTFNGLKEAWETFKKDQSVTAAMHGTAGDPRIKIDPISDDYAYPAGGNTPGIKVTNREVVSNIAYNTDFYDVNSGALGNIFENILTEILGQVFIPVSGVNDASVDNSITYQDPLGKYMELKNHAIQAKPYSPDGTATCDLALLAFGQMHSLVRAGVYDYHWNDNYVGAHLDELRAMWEKEHPGVDFPGKGKIPMPMGWYKGDAEKAEYSYGANGLPDVNRPDGSSYTTAEQAWEDGWVMRLSVEDLLDYVPIEDVNLAPGETVTPDLLPEQYRNTVYTCYRFADTLQEQNKLRINPAYGDTVPEKLKNEWDAYYREHKAYPAGTDMYAGYDGVYRLSDIRVWLEHSGDYVESGGTLTPEEEGSYEDSLFVNFPIAAVPTQTAEITLGPNGPVSYRTNLENRQASAPIRLFYAVGLAESLILRDKDGKQTGVNLSALSGEYIADHTNPDNSIWFISNWYSNTPYSGYASDGVYERGDPVVSFSSGANNSYYLFQKPVPLYAHAYRVRDDGTVAPVDNTTDWRDADGSWKAEYPNGSGNGKTEWETLPQAGTSGQAPQERGSWAGGEYIGNYDSAEQFKTALAEAMKTPERSITDDQGTSYELPASLTDAVITLTGDRLNNVDADGEGKYTGDAVSFSPNDYFFLGAEYYVPIPGTTGKDVQGDDAPGTNAARKVTRLITRKGSTFGSGLRAEHIKNKDMLCWYDTNGLCPIEIEYNSRTESGDNTRGRPTLEKLTLRNGALRAYLTKCGLSDTKEDTRTVDGEPVTKSWLNWDCAYWKSVQDDPQMRSLIEQIQKAKNPQAKFDEIFNWTVAARTGSIRVGDMFQNIRPKSLMKEGNATNTAYNYYLPTLSENATTANGLIINNYLGNNGRLSVTNDSLLVTKTLIAPEGFTLTDKEKNKTFDYQVYIEGVTGEVQAQRLIWNPFSESWQKRIASLDILTDNSSLLLDNSGGRALFYQPKADGEVRQIVAAETDGETTYYYAKPDGTASEEVCAPAKENPDSLFYLYLPAQKSASDESDEWVRRIFQSDYDRGTDQLTNCGTTTYYPQTMADNLPDPENNSEKLEPADGTHSKGTREYWVGDAELISYREVQEAEALADPSPGEAESTFDRWDHESNHGNAENLANRRQLDRFTLVTVIPSASEHTVDSTVYSPYRTRTQYMLATLTFGVQDLYDGLSVPDHTDESVKANTAPFTLKTGEGLYFLSLFGNRDYRFTERLTEEDVSSGYLLKDVTLWRSETVSETKTPEDFPARTGPYSVSGTTGNYTNRAHYTNIYEPPGSLILEKQIKDENRDLNAEFSFRVDFRATGEPLKKGTVGVRPTEKADAVQWTENPDGSLTATFTLKHGESIVFTNIPNDSEYTVTEIQSENYRLQEVQDGEGNHLSDETDPKVNLENCTVSGRIQQAVNSLRLLFINSRAVYFPFTGGSGWMLWALGLLLIAVSVCGVYLLRRKKRKQST